MSYKLNEDIETNNKMDIWNSLLERYIWMVWMSEWMFGWNSRMVNLKCATFIKKHIKQNICYHARIGMVEYKGSVYSYFNTKIIHSKVKK